MKHNVRSSICFVTATVLYLGAHVAAASEPESKSLSSSNVSESRVNFTPQSITELIHIESAAALDKIHVKQIKKIQKQRNNWFGSAMLLNLLILMVFLAISNFCFHCARGILKIFDGRISRSLRKHLLLAPTFKKNRSHPYMIGKFPLNFPTRFVSVFLAFYIAQNFIYAAVGYVYIPREYDPKNQYGSLHYQIMRQLALRLGVIATFQLPLLFLFAGRNNFLIWLTGWSLDTFNVLHKWIGRLIVMNLCFHALFYTITEIDLQKYPQIWKQSYWVFGNIAFFAVLIMFFQAMAYFRRMRYEVFLYLHIGLAIIFMICAYRHLQDEGYQQMAYATLAWWMFERAVRLVRIVWSGLRSKAVVTSYPDNVLQLDVEFSNRWTQYPGCYAFVYFARIDRGWQNHPFTLIRKPGDPTKLQMFCRVKDGLTAKTAEHLATCGGSTSMRVLLEGPYGFQRPVHTYDTVLFYSGGIGVTGTYSYAQALLNKPKDARYIFVWVVADLRAVNWFKEHLEQLLKDGRFEVQLWHSNRSSSTISDSASSSAESLEKAVESDSNEKKPAEVEAQPVSMPAVDDLLEYSNFTIRSGIPQIQQHIADVSSDMATTKSLAVVTCGPGPMNDDARHGVRAALDVAPCRVDFFEESFSW